MANIKRAAYDEDPPEQASPSPSWQALQALARIVQIVQIDEASGDVTISNGAARIVLQADGTVRIDARRVLTSADEDIALSAARIDLN